MLFQSHDIIFIFYFFCRILEKDQVPDQFHKEKLES